MAHKKTIAHLVTDTTFEDSAYEQFESIAPGSSEYYIISRRKELSHLKKIKPVFMSRLALDAGLLAKKLQCYTGVIIHGLTYPHQFVTYQLLQHSNRPYIVWIGMGFDYYDLIYPDRNDLLLPETRALINKNISAEKRQVSRSLRKLAGVAERKMFLGSTSKEDIVKEVDFFAPVLTTEHSLVAKATGDGKFPTFLDWNYGKNAQFVEKIDGPLIARNSDAMLIGNSCAPTNNHLDVFTAVNEVCNLPSTVSSPLSYGQKSYGNVVEEEGIRRFGARFSAIKKFLDYSEYLRLLSNFPIMVMNHRRQQAGGNVVIALYMGSTVFLREENPLYQYYKERGAFLFSIQAMQRNPKMLKIRLSAGEIEKNREMLRGFIGWNANIEKTKTLLQALN